MPKVKVSQRTKLQMYQRKFEGEMISTDNEILYCRACEKMSFGVCQEILTENLNMLSFAMKFVPRFLTNDHKQRCVNMCLEQREKPNEERTFTCISRIIMGDESWIYSSDLAVEEPTITKSKKVRQVQS
ncbi:hypothetical protein B7P43_G04430 [Cryptotermes secundus]|uniref:Uncharacterized protein n=1 Tax=Cryptotermes secundus TaxID=105785 RepID=A0A2J7QJV6_9NEOP|nr:hypothetical protein B7P43_G04430 [Cryptotermes secundus]